MMMMPDRCLISHRVKLEKVGRRVKAGGASGAPVERVPRRPPGC